MDYTYSLLILLLPLLSFLVIGLPDFAGNKYAWSHKAAGLIGTCSIGLVTVLSYITAFQYFMAPRLADGTFATIVPYNYTWLPLGSLHFDLGILLDPISVMMLIVISTVSFMVHIYSFGYMHGEKGFQRYYAFLSLFTMSMLGLVLPDVYVLGACGSKFISAHRFLLWTSCCRTCQQEGVHRNPFC